MLVESLRLHQRLKLSQEFSILLPQRRKIGGLNHLNSPASAYRRSAMAFDAPRLAADVRKPARNECPANCLGSSRSRLACSLTMWETL